MKRDDGGPAFPRCRTEPDGRMDCLHVGMSVRQVYKRTAILSGAILADIFKDDKERQITAREIADRAAEIADELIAEDHRFSEGEES